MWYFFCVPIEKGWKTPISGLLVGGLQIGVGSSWWGVSKLALAVLGGGLQIGVGNSWWGVFKLALAVLVEGFPNWRWQRVVFNYHLKSLENSSVTKGLERRKFRRAA